MKQKFIFQNETRLTVRRKIMLIFVYFHFIFYLKKNFCCKIFDQILKIIMSHLHRSDIASSLPCCIVVLMFFFHILKLRKWKLSWAICDHISVKNIWKSMSTFGKAHSILSSRIIFKVRHDWIMFLHFLVELNLWCMLSETVKALLRN